MNDLIKKLREAALHNSFMNPRVARTTLYSIAADALEEANGLNVTMRGFYGLAMDRAERAESALARMTDMAGANHASWKLAVRERDTAKAALLEIIDGYENGSKKVMCPGLDDFYEIAQKAINSVAAA